MLMRLRLEVAAFVRKVEHKYDLSSKRDELREAQQREASLYEMHCLLRQRKDFTNLLPPLVLQQYDDNKESQFGLAELALPVGVDINTMPLFRFKTLLGQLEKATSPADVRKVFARFHERSLFCGADHVREIFIQVGRSDLRQEVWKICAPYIPEKEKFSQILEILPRAEQSALKKLYYPKSETH